jgi:hypothetical protein
VIFSYFGAAFHRLTSALTESRMRFGLSAAPRSPPPGRTANLSDT